MQNNFTLGVGYLVDPIKVRVSRQAVSNTAGGNAYIGTQVGYSVNTITQDFLSSIQSGNFVVTSGASSSAVALSGAAGSIGSQSADDINVGSVNAGSTSDVTVSNMGDFNFANFAKMGDASNIYSIKSGTVTINGNLVLDGIGTMIIEEGTLIINGDITYANPNSSWSFVIVKPSATGTYSGVSVQVKDTVKTIS
jgi:hypothetical protein